MRENIKIFGRKMEMRSILLYSIFFVIFSLYSFVERPFIKSIYLRDDIQYFEDNHFWKIYLVIIIFFLLFGCFKIKKRKREIARFILGWLLFSILFYTFFSNFVTTNVLFLNQIKSFENESVVYEVFNYDKSNIDLQAKNGRISDFSIDQKEFIEKIDKTRERNHLEPLSKIKHGDTVHVDYKKGLFGFKYLN